MKNYFLFFFLSFILINTFMVKAQISSEFFGTRDDYKALSKRILIVETLVEKYEVINKLNKKENSKKLIADYKKFIQKYNEYIQITTYKYWKFNDSIEYKTELEVAQIKKSRSRNYALLSYVELKDDVLDSSNTAVVSIPAIKYTRIEIPADQPDYKIYIPSSYIRANNQYIEADFRVAIMAMQENIKFMMKTKENIEFQEFILEMADKNCKKLKKSTVLVEKSMLDKNLTEERAKTHCKIKIEFETIEEIEKNMFYKTKGKSAVIAFPLGILQGKGKTAQMSSVVYFKIAVDCETGNIIWTNGGSLGSITFENNNSQHMTERDFKHMQPCD